MYDPYTLYTGGYGAGAVILPGSSYEIDPMYQQLAQQQQAHLNRQLASFCPADLVPANIPAIPPGNKSECSEFAWLRKRVNEILWK